MTDNSELSNLNRRRFIKAFGMMAGASVLASNPWLKPVYAADEPASKVKLGIIGTGSRGQYLLRYMLLNPSAEFVAYCDIYDPHLKEAGDMIGPNARAFKDYRELLEMDEIQGVVIATPLFEHARMTIDALHKGKHVFCEKAMAMTPADCLAMVQAQRDTGKILQIGHQRLFSLRYLKGMEMIHAGKIGEVTQIRAYWHRNNDWRRPVPAPELERQINWRLYREFSRGLMTELASHQIQVANWALQDIPYQVFGSGSINYWKDGREVYDNVNLVYTYPSGTHLIYDSMTSNKKYGLEEQIMGPLGTMEMETNKLFSEADVPAPGIVQLINQIEKSIFDAIPVGGESWVPENPNEDKGDWIAEQMDTDGSDVQMEAFVNYVRDDRFEEHLLKEAFHASVASLLGDQAMRENRVVEWPDEYKL